MIINPPKIHSELLDQELTLPGELQLHQANISVGVASGVTAQAMSIDEAVFSDTEISSSVLKKAVVSDVRFENCLLFGTNFDSSGFSRVEIHGGMWSGVIFADCLLKDMIFMGVKINLSNFRVAKLQRVKFVDCDLTEADFQNSTLTDVSFEKCLLNRTNFSNANMKRVDLRTSDLSSIGGVASLSGATISSDQLLTLSYAFAESIGISVVD